MAHAVNARGVGLGLFVMAVCAIRRRQRAVVKEFLDAGVAVHAGKFGVNGMCKGLGRENQGLRFPIDHPGGVGIEMAIQAIAVGEFFRRAGRGLFLGQRSGTRQPKESQQAKPRQSGGPELAHDRPLAGNVCRTTVAFCHRRCFICRHREFQYPAGQTTFLSWFPYGGISFIQNGVGLFPVQHGRSRCPTIPNSRSEQLFRSELSVVSRRDGRCTPGSTNTQTSYSEAWGVVKSFGALIQEK